MGQPVVGLVAAFAAIMSTRRVGLRLGLVSVAMGGAPGVAWVRMVCIGAIRINRPEWNSSLLQKTTMELTRLEAFCKVVEAGSFTAAAAVLGTDKARLSRSVSALERELGLRLLARSTRSLRVTDGGQAVYERARAILGASDELLHYARAQQAEPSGTLRLTCSPDFALVAANRWITGYLQRWPRMAVDVDLSSRRIDLVHEGLDLALRVGPLDDSRLAARWLGSLRYGLFASPAYLAAAGSPATPAGLREHALLMFSTGSGRTEWTLLAPEPGAPVERIERRGGAAPRVRAGSISLLLQACVAGLGVARLPLAAVQLLPPGTLQPVLPAWTPQPVPVHAVFPSHRFVLPKLRSFIDHAVASFEPPAAGG
jgi:LysR family transcriptional regulator, regulator for bpeEF and oprC